MKTYAFDFKNYRIHLYPSKIAAQSDGNGRILASTLEELLAERITGDQLVGMYNKLVPDAPIKRFETKEKGIVRLWALAEAKAIHVADNSASAETSRGSASDKKEEKKSMAKKAKKEKVADESEAGKRGRQSEFAGKRITINTEDGENPRREGSHGYNSMEIIVNAGKKGILYEDFIAAGGRRVDLAWDYEKENVVLSD